MFFHMPVVYLAILILVAVFGNYVPLFLKELLYATSLTLKSIIMFFLPVIIFSLLFRAATKLAAQAAGIIVLIFFFVCVSNFIATFLSHYVGTLLYYFDIHLEIPKTVTTLNPLWAFDIHQFIANDKAMIVGVTLGILFGFFAPRIGNAIANICSTMTAKLLELFTYILPFFIIGFMIKLQFEGIISVIFSEYLLIFLVVFLAQLCYVGFWYVVASEFVLRDFVRLINAMLPATITAFSTMSSAAAMPLTIIAAEKNAENKRLAHAIIPATVNVHLMGDCFAIPIFAYAILRNYGFPAPTFGEYLIFTSYFVLAKFSVAAIPAGGIIVMLPILERHLHFNADMLSLITMLYVLFDPVITMINVLGNGAFAKIMDKIFMKIGFRYEQK